MPSLVGSTFIAIQDLIIFSESNISATKIAEAKKNEIVYGISSTNTNPPWYKIRTNNGYTGWCNSSYLIKQGFSNNGKNERIKSVSIDYQYGETDLQENIIKNNDFGNTKKLEQSLNKLNDLIGLEKVKDEVKTLINSIKIRKMREEKGLKQPPLSLHLVFSGNPGTGKTTVARLLSKIYKELGILSKGHLIEVDRSDLVAGYIGQTAIKVKEVLSEAIGGILFIDEAYSLISNDSKNDFGSEAIDTLLKLMEDNRDKIIVIVAGYPDLMEEFINSNPGLKSRFNTFINFQDYNSNELYDIFVLLCKENNYRFTKEVKEYLKQYFINLYNNRGSNFANGREIRNYFEKVIKNHANRLANDHDLNDEKLITLILEDCVIER